MTRKTLFACAVRALATFAAAVFALAAATPASAATLRWAAANDILTLDPHAQNHAATTAVLMQVYEGLTRYNEQHEIEPCLAARWSAVTPTQLRLELRRGVTFHDGAPFSADDVVFSLARIRQPQGTMQAYASGIREVKKIDDHTVDLILLAPNPVLLRNLVDVRIMSRRWAESHQTAGVQNYAAKQDTFASRNANGTGPYRIVSWAPDGSVSMAAHEGWWDRRKGNVAQVTYVPIRSDNARLAALRAGDADLVTDVPLQDIDKLRTDRRLKVIEGPVMRTVFIALDQGSAELKHANIKGRNPFKDRRVREALNLALDREALRRDTLRGLSMPAALLVAPGVNGHSAELDKPLKPDLDKARRLLADAGYPRGFSFQLNCPNNGDTDDEKLCTTVASMWARIGFEVKPVSDPTPAFVRKVQVFDASAYLMSWSAATRDGQFWLQPLVRTRAAGAGGQFNFAGVSDARVDQLVDAMKTETDAAKRNAMIREALQRTRDEFLFVPLHHPLQPWAMGAGVSTPHRADGRPELRFTSVK